MTDVGPALKLHLYFLSMPVTENPAPERIYWCLEENLVAWEEKKMKPSHFYVRKKH